MKIKFPLFLFLVLLAGLLLNGCRLTADLMAAPTSTNIPTTSIPQPTKTSTPLPSATHTSTSVPTSTHTPVPSPTRDRTATMAAMATFSAEKVNEILKPDLEAYGVDPADGHIAWLQTNQIKMELTNYIENRDYLLEEAGVLTDFVVQSRITWDTSGALSLCGITFHAQDDLAAGAQNRFFLMRLQFAPLWTIYRWEYGLFQSFIPGDWISSRNIHDENGSTNLVSLVVRGKDIDVFINRDKQRRVEDTKLPAGRLALSAFQESGRTTCKFENTWVWAFDK